MSLSIWYEIDSEKNASFYWVIPRALYLALAMPMFIRRKLPSMQVDLGRVVHGRSQSFVDLWKFGAGNHSSLNALRPQ